MMGFAQGGFVSRVHYAGPLPAEGTEGLKEGADVSVQGNVVGTVRRIRRDHAADRSVAEVVIDREFSDFVRSDSKVRIRRTLGFGDAYLQIDKGTTIMLPTDG